jgi:hypothetical protein
MTKMASCILLLVSLYAISFVGRYAATFHFTKVGSTNDWFVVSLIIVLLFLAWRHEA